MNVVIVPGYGDGTDYIKKLTSKWPDKYGIDPLIYPFGTVDESGELAPPENYDDRWQAFEKVIQPLGPTAVIGISFGVGIAARALQDHPEIVTKSVFISGPHKLSDLKMHVVNSSYKMLNKSLPAFDPNTLPVEKIMTIRPWADNVIPPNIVAIDGATNLRVPGIPLVGHGAGIAAAFLFRSKAMTDFIKN